MKSFFKKMSLPSSPQPPATLPYLGWYRRHHGVENTDTNNCEFKNDTEAWIFMLRHLKSTLTVFKVVFFLPYTQELTFY